MTGTGMTQNELTGANGDTAGAAFADAIRQALAPHADGL